MTLLLAFDVDSGQVASHAHVRVGFPGERSSRLDGESSSPRTLTDGAGLPRPRNHQAGAGRGELLSRAQIAFGR